MAIQVKKLSYLDRSEFWKRLLEVSFVKKKQTEVGTRVIRPLDESQEDFFYLKEEERNELFD